MYRIQSELVRSARPKRFREGGRLHRNVRLFLVSDVDGGLDQVDSVEYELHPTFRDRYRTSNERATDFEIRIWTYGYFKVRGTVRLKNGTTEEATGFVRW